MQALALFLATNTVWLVLFPRNDGADMTRCLFDLSRGTLNVWMNPAYKQFQEYSNNVITEARSLRRHDGQVAAMCPCAVACGDASQCNPCAPARGRGTGRFLKRCCRRASRHVVLCRVTLWWLQGAQSGTSRGEVSVEPRLPRT